MLVFSTCIKFAKHPYKNRAIPIYVWLENKSHNIFLLKTFYNNCNPDSQRVLKLFETWSLVCFMCKVRSSLLTLVFMFFISMTGNKCGKQHILPISTIVDFTVCDDAHLLKIIYLYILSILFRSLCFFQILYNLGFLFSSTTIWKKMFNEIQL